MSKTQLIININPMNFDEVMKNPVVMIDFWADWCQPCKVQDPVLEEVANEVKQKAVIAKIDVDDNRYLSQKLGVRNIPTLIIYHQGKEVERMAGIHSKDIVLGKIKKYINQ